MKIKLFIIGFFLLSFTFSPVFANEDETKLPARFALGLNAGTVVGNGLLFRIYQDKQLFQATFAGLINKDNGEEYLNTSFSYARYLNKYNYRAPLGLKFIVGGEVVYDKSDDTYNNKINFGTGIGFDIGHIMEQGFILSFDIIYTLSYKGLKNPAFNAFSPKPALGIMYNFQ